jgi:hypothetical protein
MSGGKIFIIFVDSGLLTKTSVVTIDALDSSITEHAE